MVTYTGWGTADPGFTWNVDAGVYSLGTAFYVNTTGLYLTGYRLFRVTGHPVSGINFGTFAGAIGGAHGATGSVLTGTTLSGQSTTTDGWNNFSLAVPYALTANTVYYAEYFTDGGVNGGYPALAFAFSADHNASPIIMPADGVQVFGNIPYNGGYVTPVASLSPVNASFHNALYGLDITVSTSGNVSTPTSAADSFPLADSLARGGLVQPRSLADSVPLSDALARGALRMPRALADGFPLADALNSGATVLFGTPRHLLSSWGNPRHLPSNWGNPRHIN